MSRVLRRRLVLPLLTAGSRARMRLRELVGHVTVGVRAIVVDDGGRVLLVRHSYGAGRWHLPGGGVKRRETLAGAAARELREEAGIEVVGGAGGLELFGCYSNLEGGRSDHVAVYVARRWVAHDWNSIEIAEQRFVDPAQPPARVSPGTVRRLDEWRSGCSPSSEW